MAELIPRAAAALAKAKELTLAIDDEDWYDLWHTHPDWEGDGNEGPEARRPFLVALFTMLGRLRLLSAAFARPNQFWALVDANDSANDAVYFHTQNPNYDNFPIEFDFPDFDAQVPEWLTSYVDRSIYRIGAASRDGRIEYYVIPIEAERDTSKGLPDARTS